MSKSIKPFWYSSSTNRIEFDRLKLIEDFLSPLGFVSSSKQKVLFKKSEINNTIYPLNDSDELYDYVLGFLKNTSEERFLSPEVFGVRATSKKEFWEKRDVINRWMVLGLDICINIFKSLKLFKEFSFGTIFRDTSSESFFSFKNGIVSVDKNGMRIIPVSSLKGKYRFTSSLIENLNPGVEFDFLIKDKLNLDCEFSLYLKSITSIPNPKLSHKKSLKPKFGKEYIFSKPDFESLVSAIGYLIHNKGLGGLSKMVILQDRNIDGVNAKGGTGKSLVVNSLRKVIKVYEENAGHLDVRSPFKYQGLNFGDKVFFLDELHPNYGMKIQQLFTDITSQIVIQKKYMGSFVLRGDDCPKLLGASNFIVFNSDSISELRRLHICEIGDIGHYYPGELNLSWSSSKKMFDDWCQEDWLEFYNFIFYCVSFYLKNGLLPNPNPNWQSKNINLKLNQTYGMVNVDWVLKYLTTTRLEKNHNIDGSDPLAVELLQDFTNEVGQTDEFNETRFKKMLYEVCEVHGYTYNPLQVGGGNTPNSRKKQRGGKHCVHITHPNDFLKSAK
jgi:hypothetical protein